MSGADFRTLQYAFAAHLRDPERNAPPAGLEDRRLQVYRELFYNNIEGLLEGNFPVIRRITPDARWHALVRAFFSGHASHTPLFTEIGREFLRFLDERDGADDPPFLAELAHYEWIELALAIDEASIDAIPHDPSGDVVARVPLLSPLARALVYAWPVHRIREDFQPAEAPPQPTCLVVVRNRHDDVAFMEVSPLTIHLLEALKDNPGRTGLQCVESLAAQVDASQRDALVAAGCGMLRQLRQRDVLLGTT
ncbi:MAG TPA: putative DNA-binding domain-containing protein [Xanthomonadales bacterium]|nr:putative DNA-binding domain-containing protein [Xanthomonadales bacterium]